MSGFEGATRPCSHRPCWCGAAPSDADLLGGDTPFISPSAVPSHKRQLKADTGLDHKPLRIKIEGNEATRDVNVVLCALAWIQNEREPMRGVTHEEFMKGFIAGANTDMMALGIGPLISIAEVKSLATHPQMIAASDQAQEKARKEGGDRK
jgi:hypothetical protein